MHLKSVILFCIFSVIALHGNSQISVYTEYNQNQIDWQDEWQSRISPDVIYGKSYSIGVAYWFRLKNRRIEFHPGAYIHLSNQRISPYSNNNGLPDWTIAKQNGYGVELPIHIYFLDFKEITKAPTYSKEGTLFKKGVYGYVTPGYRRVSYELIGYESEVFMLTLDEVDKQNLFTIAAGFGLDVGIGDLFTISPYGGVEFVPNMKWETLNDYIETSSSPGNDGRDNMTTLIVGIRLNLRPDYFRQTKVIDHISY